MGIFDDAIREHLELKRHSGADEQELKEMEDEAFGPPARPGDPDFPDSSGEAAAESDEPSSGVFDAQASDETPGDAVIEAPTDEAAALKPINEGSIPETDEASSEPEPEPEAEPAAESEPPTLETEAERPESAEEAPAETLGETVEAEVLPDEDLPEASEPSRFTTQEREAIADQPTVFFDQQPADLELGDLELDIDEEIEEVGGAVSEDEPLIVEEAFKEPITDPGFAEPPHESEPEPAAPEDGAAEEDSAAGEEGSPAPATGEDDVLEETPEFLRDNPDDDELWFEQGEPKDFDF